MEVPEKRRLVQKLNMVGGRNAAESLHGLLVTLFCYLLTKQITVGFLAILAGNFLCVIPQNWVHYLPFGLSGTVRVDWDSFGMGIPAGMAMMILIGCLAVTLSLLELLGSKNLLGR